MLENAYKEACQKGYTKNFKAKLNIIGQADVGKTSLSHRLMGQPLQEDKQSTEGIAIHHVTSHFKPNDLNTGMWVETTNGAEKLLKKFGHKILMEYAMVAKKQKGQKSNDDNTTVSDNKEIISIHHNELQMSSNTSITHEIGSDYSLDVWDFGGQSEFLPIHHLFLNVESTNVIVMDISKGLKDPIKDESAGPLVSIPYTQVQYLHYWLGIMHSQVTEKTIPPNVALVLTHKDMIQDSDKDLYIKEYISEIHNSIQDKPYSEYLTNSNIFVIDNKNGNEEDFTKLQSEVFKMITKQISWGIRKPTRWLKLGADIIEEATMSNKPYLSMSQVEKLAEMYGISKNELNLFLNFHHILGDLVYYVNPGLNDTVITDPQWLVDVFKALVTQKEFKKEKHHIPEVFEQLKQKKLTFGILQSVWPEADLGFLTELFQNFNLLLPISNQTELQFVAPSMLPLKENNMHENEPFKSMLLVYNSEHTSKAGDILPVGKFHKLLSESYKRKDWKVCLGDHLSQTDASFLIAENVCLALTLVAEGSKVRVSIWSSREVIDHNTLSFLLETTQALDEELEKCSILPRHTFLLLCPFWKPEDGESCLVKVTEVMDRETGKYKIQSKFDRCFLHKEKLDSSFFPEPRTGDGLHQSNIKVYNL